MADENATSQERTEHPTQRRRDKAREEGQIARSQELSGAAVLLAGTLALAAGGAALTGYPARVLREAARAISADTLTPRGAELMLRSTAVGFVMALLPFLVSLAGAAVLVNLLQTRGALSGKALAPKLSNLSPAQALRRMLGWDGLFNLLKSVLKFAVLGFVAWVVIRRAWPELAALGGAPPVEVARVLKALSVRLALTAGFAFLAIAAIDYAFQFFRHERRLRMTRDEIVREQRDTEGNPLVKSRILSLGRARARRRMLQQVPTADVVVVNPTEIAIALRYDTTVAAAPIVVAMGQRKLAERIRAIATKHGVPIIENRPVARALLATATVGAAIPPALYAAVAEILAYVYRQRARRRGQAPLRVAGRPS
jgi:flagellar biosynthesis protein FlhB